MKIDKKARLDLGAPIRKRYERDRQRPENPFAGAGVLHDPAYRALLSPATLARLEAKEREERKP